MSFITPGGLGQIAVVSGGPPSTLDPATIGGSSNGTLSSGNMVFTAPAGSQSSVCGTRFRNSGKYYFEFQVLAVPTTAATQQFGAGINLTNTPIYNVGGGGQYDLVQDNATSNWYTMNNSTLGTSPGSPVTAGDTVQVAFDMTSTTNARIYFGINNVWWTAFGSFVAANPAFSGLGAGSTYTYYPCCSVYTSASLQFANTAAKFNYTPPSGFSPWN